MNRAVHVRLSREVHDGIQALLAQQSLRERAVADTSVDEAQLLAVLDGIQIREIPGISQGVEHHDALTRVLRKPVMHEVRTDEARTAGNQQSSHPSTLPILHAIASANAPGWTGAKPERTYPTRCTSAAEPRSDIDAKRLA